MAESEDGIPIGDAVDEVEELLDYIADAIKALGDDAVTTAVDMAQSFIGGGSMSDQTFVAVTDTVVQKMKQGLAVLESMGVEAEDLAEAQADAQAASQAADQADAEK